MSSQATGPRSDAGKERSSLNATKHGLRSERPVLPGEDGAEWDAFRADVVNDLGPATTFERELADRVALQMWRLRRVARYEVEVATDAYEEATGAAAGTLLGMKPDDPAWKTLAQAHRDLDDAREDLATDEAVRALVAQAATAPDPTPVDPTLAMLMLQLVGQESIRTMAEPTTMDVVRRALLAATGQPLAETLQRAAVAAEEECRESAAEVGRYKKRFENIAAEMARQGESQAHDRRLLQKQALDRVVRYEAHVSRQLTQAMKLLRQLQAERRAQEEQVQDTAEEPAPTQGIAEEAVVGRGEVRERITPATRRSETIPTGSFGNRDEMPVLREPRIACDDAPAVPAAVDAAFVRYYAAGRANGGPAPTCSCKKP